MDESIENKLNTINSAFRAQYPITPSQAVTETVSADYWCVETHDDYVIVANSEKYYRVGFTMNGDKPVFDERDKWLEVVRKISWDEVKAALELKYGARNSRGDASRLQMIHDYAVENGAACGESEKSVDVDSLVTFGASVKALGDGRVGGYLVKFSTANDPDMTGDYFTSQTDFGDADKSPVLYHHGLDVKVGKRVIGDATLRRDEVGIWAEAQLKMRDAYEQTIYKLAEAGKLGWSSGTASHLVERKAQGNAQEITRWPLGLDASLTPTPAEPRNSATPIKSLSIPSMLDLPETEQENRSAEQQTANEQPIKTNLGDQAMSDEVLDSVKALTAKVEALETVIKSAPPIKEVGTGVTVTSDPADRPFVSLAENFNAIKQFELSKGRVEHPRLTNPAIKATGASEGIPADGGFLIDPTLAGFILRPMHEEGPFTRLARKLPTSSNYGWINGVDETSRATGSRWGGIRGYRLAEGGTKTASQPKFRRINWELKKYAVLVYATDELLQDKALFSEIVRTGAGEELAFMANDDLVNGVGAAGPLGFLQSPALVTVAKTLNQTADTVSFQNIVDMWARLHPRSKQSAGTAWFVNSDVMPQLDTLTLTAGTAGIPPRFVNYNDQGVMSIKGKPVFETEFNSTLGDLGDIVLADMSEYLMWEHSAGVQEAASIHVQFLTDETVFRLVMRVDGQTALNSAITPYKGSNTQSPFVTLAERA